MMIYAHRGWHDRSAPENTMAAFERAARGGFGIETDLRTDLDGRMILFHDRTVDGLPVDLMTLADLRARSGRRVPELEELLATGIAAPLNLEIKTRAAWRSLKRSGLRLPTGLLVSSFIHDVAADAHAEGLDAAFLIASSPLPAEIVALTSGTVRTAVVDFNVCDAGLVRRLAQGGVETIVYGADHAVEHALVASWECRASITDRPGWARAATGDAHRKAAAGHPDHPPP